MENAFLILNNGLTILLLQEKGESGALFRKKFKFNIFLIREKYNVLFKFFTILDYFLGNNSVC